MQSKRQSGVCLARWQRATKHRLTATQQVNEIINTTIFQETVGRKVIGVRRIVLWPLLHSFSSKVEAVQFLVLTQESGFRERRCRSQLGTMAGEPCLPAKGYGVWGHEQELKNTGN